MKFWFGRGRRKIPPNASFRLTQEGREKLQDFSGDPKSQILVTLETQGTCDIDELSQRSGLSRGQVEKMIPGLIRGGYIQYMSSSMGSEEDM